MRKELIQQEMPTQRFPDEMLNWWNLVGPYNFQDYDDFLNNRSFQDIKNIVFFSLRNHLEEDFSSVTGGAAFTRSSIAILKILSEEDYHLSRKAYGMATLLLNASEENDLDEWPQSVVGIKESPQLKPMDLEDFLEIAFHLGNSVVAEV